ncbi:hypothetical protein TEQG_08079 [Trichophyton equinum CBS 127.97]|uniref:Kinesin light chain n=1 Tax=Trichophyton equinum (strain ATCC MYA-4606 / CBS 127.97) TaxID=559882 RepID=F2Q4I2_TRIEC|nr:hypothetical protein TEQG_08079 [Trichophyton equinum CBS 127.97]
MWAFGPTHPTTVVALCYVQVMLHREGKREESEDAHTRMIELKSATMKILLAQNNYKEAEEMQRVIVDLFKEIYGVEHKYTVTSMAPLANLLIKKEELDEAESLLRKTVKYIDIVIGPEHRFTQSVLNNLGSALAMQGKRAEAKEIFRLTLQRKVNALRVGLDDPQVAEALNNLYSCLEDNQTLYEV